MCKRIILNLRLLSVDDLIKAALFCYKPLCWPSFKSQFDKCVASAADRRLFAVSQPFLLLDICPHKWYSLENCTHCKRMSKKDMNFFYTGWRWLSKKPPSRVAFWKLDCMVFFGKQHWSSVKMLFSFFNIIHSFLL